MRAISENTARAVRGGKYLTTRYADMIRTEAPAKRVKKDTRSGDEIAADIISRIARKEGEE